MEGGTTPSFGHLHAVRDSFSLPIYPIIRPRPGDFLYSDEDFNIMLRDARLCKKLGFDGIVTGLLDVHGNIDIKRTAIIVDAVYPLGVTFHRAFDRCRDPLEALEQLIEAGCERILTSGQQKTAVEGAALIEQLQAAADGRIVIMPGSGVRKENIRALAEKTACREFHASLRSTRPGGMQHIHTAFADSAESYHNYFIDQAAVEELREALVK
jgi:copper homeostasis protein